MAARFADRCASHVLSSSQRRVSPFEATERVSLTDRVHAAIRRAILRLELPPGSPLVEADLARMLNVSKSPVREALLRLTHEGLVSQVPYRGCVVTLLDAPELLEIYALREVLEPLAVSLATPRLGSVDIAEMRQLLTEAAAALRRGDLSELAERNAAFHLSFSSASGNRHLYTVLANLHDKVTLSSVLGWQASATMPSEHDEHTAILDAVQVKDGDRAADLMRAHIRRFAERFAIRMQSHGSNDGPTPTLEET